MKTKLIAVAFSLSLAACTSGSGGGGLETDPGVTNSPGGNVPIVSQDNERQPWVNDADILAMGNPFLTDSASGGVYIRSTTVDDQYVYNRYRGLQPHAGAQAQQDGQSEVWIHDDAVNTNSLGLQLTYRVQLITDPLLTPVPITAVSVYIRFDTVVAGAEHYRILRDGTQVWDHFNRPQRADFELLFRAEWPGDIIDNRDFVHAQLAANWSVVVEDGVSDRRRLITQHGAERIFWREGDSVKLMRDQPLVLRKAN